MRRLVLASMLAVCVSLSATTAFARAIGQPVRPFNPIAHPFIVIRPHISTLTYSAGFSPQQVRGAYGMSATLLGTGVTIAIVDAYDDPTASSDFDTFSRQFSLPTISGGCGCFQKVDQNGGVSYPAADPANQWAGETALDIEWAHAMAPQAKILLVEANDAGFANMFTAEQYAAAHAKVVSNSWGSDEFVGETADDTFLNVPNVAILASAGDSGSPADYPSASPYVLSVGGTALTVAGTCGTKQWNARGCTYGSESAWTTAVACTRGTNCWGTGGGASAYEAMPGYQTGYCAAIANQNDCSGQRGTPDIAWVADPATGVAVYNTTCQVGACNWTVVGGTSNSSPSLAGVIADVDALRHITLTTNSLATRFMYQNAGQGWNVAQDYHDVTAGSNITNVTPACCNAGTGYDFTTGLGSPSVSNWLTNV
jgi:subtilase family serine protease